MVKTKAEARAIGRLGKGIKKTYADRQAAKEQRRQAGLASGRARRKLVESLNRHDAEVGKIRQDQIDAKLAAELQATLNSLKSKLD